MPKVPPFFSDLRADDQQQIRRSTEFLCKFFDSCKTRMETYQTGNAKEEHNSVFKLITDLRIASAMAAAMVDELIEKHGIPDATDLRHIGEEMRVEMRNVLAQKTQGKL